MADKFKMQGSSGISKARQSLMEELDALVKLGIKERGTVGTRAELLSVMLPQGALTPLPQASMLTPPHEIVPRMTAEAEAQIELGALPGSSEQLSTQRLPESVLIPSQKDTPIEIVAPPEVQHAKEAVTKLRETLVAQNLTKALIRQQQGIPQTESPVIPSPMVVEDQHVPSKEKPSFPTKGRARPHKRHGKTSKHKHKDQTVVAGTVVSSEVVSATSPILLPQDKHVEGTPPILSQGQLESSTLAIEAETVAPILDSTTVEIEGSTKLVHDDTLVPLPLEGLTDEATTKLPPPPLPLVDMGIDSEDLVLAATVELSRGTAAAEDLLRIIQRPADALPDSRLTDTLVETLQEVDQLEEARSKVMASETAQILPGGSGSSVLESSQVVSVVTRPDLVELGQLPEALSEVGTSMLAGEIDLGVKELLDSFAIAKRHAEQLEKTLQDTPPLARLATLITAAAQYETLVVDEPIAPERQQDVRIFYNQLLINGISQEQSLEIGLPAVEGTIPKLLASIQTAIALFEANGFFHDTRNMPTVLLAIKAEKKRSKGLVMSNQDTKEFYRALLREMRNILQAEAEQAELQYRQFKQQHEMASPIERLRKHTELRSQLHPKDSWPQPMLSQYRETIAQFKMVTGGSMHRTDPPQDMLGVNLDGLPASSLHRSMVIF